MNHGWSEQHMSGIQIRLIDRNTLEWVYPDIVMAIIQNSPATQEAER